MSKERKTTIIIAALLVIVGLISFLMLSKVFSNPETFKNTIQVLDDKKNTVAKLSAISIAAASAIDLIPGDAGASIAKELVDLGGYFVLLFAAIYLEKLLISIGGFVAFKVLIPIGLFLIAGFMMLKKDYLKALGTKLISIGLVLFLLVPSSVWVSNMVDKTHDMSKQQAIEQIGEETDLIENETEEEAVVDDSANEEDSEESSLLGKITEGGSSLVGKIKEGGSSALASAKEVPKKMNELLDNLIEEVAYFFVSICIIPIVVLILLTVLLKQLLGFKGSGAGDYTALLKEIRSIRREGQETLE